MKVGCKSPALERGPEWAREVNVRLRNAIWLAIMLSLTACASEQQATVLAVLQKDAPVQIVSVKPAGETARGLPQLAHLRR